MDWARWVERWDRQQLNYLPDRDNALALMLDVVERLVGEPLHLIDLASGPGTIAARAVARFPGTRAVAVDLDPFLLELGRRTTATDRISFHQADLRVPTWDAGLGSGQFDAVCSATSLHYLSAPEFAELAIGLARRVRSGGVFVNLDTLRLGTAVPRLDELAGKLRTHAWDGTTTGGGEDWEGWWRAARAEPEFAPLFAERDPLTVAPTDGLPVTLPEMVDALRTAGFAEVGVLHQVADKHLVAAIR